MSGLEIAACQMAGHNEYLAVQSDNEMSKKIKWQAKICSTCQKPNKVAGQFFFLFRALNECSDVLLHCRATA